MIWYVILFLAGFTAGMLSIGLAAGCAREELTHRIGMLERELAARDPTHANGDVENDK
ncbi:hypothetical protein [Bifidobacterium sp. SO1]|uniref:hypothetical protein n=1 Tax=Bifidobacterium sp. SO1 TaxID=2809029 RepID=UPI001BDCA1F2|nr:hypothetical protein [Bifidobacterium sp. SO1]MBT1161809.1 hypothetical protein [Bifidobacterium sp. SO1]